MISPQNPTAFFTLPSELRQIIYKAVLASPLHGPALLTACREIYLESHKFLFQRPLEFRSQKCLFDWLDKVPHKLLSHAREFSINIREVDLRILLDTTSVNHRSGNSPRPSIWGLYELELDKLYTALSRLPNVEKITVRAIADRQSYLYREFLRKFLTLATLLYPNLLTINLEGNFHHVDLTFLSGFEHLQSFSFDGDSASSPTETAKILSGLKGLTSLSLISQSTIPTSDSRIQSNFTSERQCLTGGVVRLIDQLKSSSFADTVPVSALSLFLTPGFLSHKSLKMLTICLSQTADNETLSALGNSLGETHIRTLSLDWPQLEPEVLDTFSLLPEGLEALWIRARSAKAAFEILCYIAEQQSTGRFRALREVIILRSTQFYGAITCTGDRKDGGAESFQSDSDSMHPESGDTGATNFVHAQSRLSASGTRVAWCTERP